MLPPDIDDGPATMSNGATDIGDDTLEGGAAQNAGHESSKQREQEQDQTSAGSRVVAVYELTEMILANLPPRDIVMAQKICKTTRDVVNSSKTIQSRLYALEYADDGIAYYPCRRVLGKRAGFPHCFDFYSPKADCIITCTAMETFEEGIIIGYCEKPKAKYDRSSGPLITPKSSGGTEAKGELWRKFRLLEPGYSSKGTLELYLSGEPGKSIPEDCTLGQLYDLFCAMQAKRPGERLWGGQLGWDLKLEIQRKENPQ